MKITLASVQNFKRIQDVTIVPDADKAIILIGGRNAMGKSSLLDALTAAFGGKNALPADPVRHGAESAEIKVELDGGALIVRRTIKPDGESTLEVRDAEGRMRSPQAVLDRLIGARFLDPLAFLQLSPGDQRKALLALVDRDGTIAKLDERRQRVFDRRTEVGRDYKRAAAQLDGVVEVAPAEVIDVAALTEEAAAIENQRRAAVNVRHAVERAETELAAAEREVDRIESELAALAEKLEAAEVRLARCKVDVEKTAEAADANATTAIADLDARRDKVNADLRRAHQHNQKVATDVAQADRRLALAAEVKRLGSGVDTLTGELEKIDADKAEFLRTNQLPVDGLDVDANGIRFNAVPLEQASGAEQLRVALALAMAASPNLHDVWVRDASLLDDESRAALEAAAATMGITLWLEVVGNRDPGAVIIHEGRRIDRAAEHAAS